MNGKNEYCMRAVLQTVDLLLDLLDEADPASAGSYFHKGYIDRILRYLH